MTKTVHIPINEDMASKLTLEQMLIQLQNPNGLTLWYNEKGWHCTMGVKPNRSDTRRFSSYRNSNPLEAAKNVLDGVVGALGEVDG